MTWENSWVATALTGGVSVIIAFATFWMALGTRITTALNKAEHADAQAALALTQAVTVSLKHDLLSKDVNEARVHMAERIAHLESATRNTAEALQQAEERITTSVENMGNKLEKMNETIIRSLTEVQRKVNGG